MLTHFPEPVEGELLYGLLGRHRRASGGLTASDHATDLFGRRHAVAGFGLPSRIDALAQRVPSRLGLDGRKILLRHTLFPYYVAHRDESVRDKSAAELLADGASSAQIRLGVSTFRVRPHNALRFCPECLAAQRDLVGEATWLVAHQLPGSVVCHVHGRELRDSLVTQSTAGRHGYVAPAAAYTSSPPRVEPSGEALDRLVALARANAVLATGTSEPRGLDHWDTHYRERLGAVGLMRSPGKVDQSGLEVAFRAFWGAVLDRLPAPVSALGETGWLAAMTRTHRKAFHPLFHVLLDTMLATLETDRVVASDRVVPVRRKRLDRAAVASRTSRIASPARDWTVVDLALSDSLRAAASGILSLVPPVRVTEAELERRVATPGWIAKRRRKLPLAAAALASIKEPLAAFRRRRAIHWAGELGADCRPWKVMRAAGLRSEHLPMIRSAVWERAAASAGR